LSANVEELLEGDGNSDWRVAALLRRVARLTRLAGLLRRITTLLGRIARLLRRIAARLTGLREGLGLSLELAAEGVNSLRREALESSCLNGGVDLACVESAAAISVGSEESVGQLLEHLVQGNVLVEVDALGVVAIVDLNELSSGLRAQRLATKLNLSQFNSADLTRAILIDAIEPSSQGLHLLSINSLIILVVPRLTGLARLSLRRIAALLGRIAALLRGITTLLRRITTLLRRVARLARLTLRGIATLLGRVAGLSGLTLRRIATLLRRVSRLTRLALRRISGLSRLTLRRVTTLLRRIRHVDVC
jgi:hypothetical protein